MRIRLQTVKCRDIMKILVPVNIFHTNERRTGDIVTESITEVTKGEVKGFSPEYRQMKRRIHGSEDVCFTLVTPEGEQEVKVWIHQSNSGSTNGPHAWSLIVVPVETFDTKEGARSIYVKVDTAGKAIFE